MTVAERLLELARMGPMAIYTDIDGTISPIAPTPAAATLMPGAADALKAIAGLGVRVVAISGRAAADARRMVGLDQIDYAGNHGFELLTSGGSVVSEQVAAGSVAVQSALAELALVAHELPTGVLIEDKTFTGSVHYRLTADPAAAAINLKHILSAIAERTGVVITEGRLVYELRPPIHINKGVFAANDIHLHKIETAAFLGDDLTDLDGFRAIHGLVETGELTAGAAIGVRAAESAAEVIAESDLLVDGVAGMVSELDSFARLLAETHRQ